VANESYYLGKPKIDGIRAVFVPSAQTRAIMLETGELDLAELDRDSYRQIAGSPNVAFSIDPDRSDTLLFLNVMRPNLTDVRVRRAISLSIDRNALASVSAFRRYTVTLANGYADPWSFAFNPARPPPPYDPAAAARLLEDAGWRLGPGGIRYRDGRPLTVSLIARAGATEQNALTTRVQSMLHSAGIDAQIKAVTSELLFAPAAEHGVLADGAYDLLVTTYGNFADPDPSWILTCARVEPKGYNESRYCNPALDRLAQEGLDSYDPAVRKAKYAAIEKIVAADVPIAYLFWSKSIYGMNPRLRGFSYDGQSATWNASNWYLVPPRR
jgi:peptide/nickel transport system substrate-binding protein